jgi:hypothetical protein
MKSTLIIKSTISIALIFLLGYGCFDDLNTLPIDPDVATSNNVYENPASYQQVLAKIYAGLAITGQQGPAGKPDIEGIDEGFGQYLRMYWYHQELSTDESVIAWNDQTIKDFHAQKWSADDGFVFALYSRIFYQVSVCNEFIRETSDEKLASRGVDDALKAQVHGYRAEARFLRALSYWHALDLFRNVPFVTENDKVGAFFPRQIQAPELFTYIESELKDIENQIAAPHANPYGRADQAAVWTLLAKLYLNAEVYTGTSRYADCVTYCQKVINAGYTLEPDYHDLFLADNDKSKEIIFPVAFDGVNTRTYGGTTFIIRAALGGSMVPKDYGVDGAWAGTRTTKEFVHIFPVTSDLVVAPNEGKTASYTKIYVPGEYQGWNGSNTNTSLSSVHNDKMYEGHVYFPTDNSPFFFTRFPGFGGKLGDNEADGTLESNGDTIRASVAGLYFIQVNLNNNTYTMTRRSWSIFGSATGGNDLDLTWNDTTKALEVKTALTAGQFKFRVDHSDAVNLGDDHADAILTQGGAPINITSGPYLVRLYPDKPDYTYEIRISSYDRRGSFYTKGQNIEINDLSIFTDGYAITKFQNVRSDGGPTSDPYYPDTDFPMFRLADVLLMASEAILRSNGDRALALDYFNQVRTRAYKSTDGNILDADLTLPMILDERGRELYWECHRRTDLVRFGKFSQTDYVWAWKGGVKEGKSVEQFRDVYPLPTSDLSANPNLEQNNGY